MDLIGVSILCFVLTIFFSISMYCIIDMNKNQMKELEKINSNIEKIIELKKEK